MLGLPLTRLIAVGPYLGIVDIKLRRLCLVRHPLKLPVWIEQINGVPRFLVVIWVFNQTSLLGCILIGDIGNHNLVTADSLRTPGHTLRDKLPLLTLLIQL